MAAGRVQQALIRQALSGADGRVMRWAELAGRGAARSALMAMMDRGEVVRVDHGLYRLADAPTDAYSDWEDVAANYTTDGFVVCLLTAAKHHDLILHMPAETWVGLPMGAKPTKAGIRPVSWRRTDSDGRPHRTWTTGVDRVEVGGRSYRITSPARTVVDLYRWRNTIPDGQRVHLEALARYDDKRLSRQELRRIAHEFGVSEGISDLLRAKSEFTNSY